MPPPPVPLEDLLDEYGQLEVEAVRTTLPTRDIELGTVTDEVLLLAGQRPDAPPREHWTPWLYGRPETELATARDVAVRFLVSRGLLEVHDDDRLEFAEPLATLAWVLRNTIGLVTIATATAEEPVHRAGVFLLDDGTALHDDIDRDRGLHHLTLRSNVSASAWLAAMLDPAGCAQRTALPVTAASVEDLSPRPNRLPGGSRSHAVMVRSAQRDGVDSLVSVTGIGTTAGWWMIQARDDQQPGALLQQLDAQGVRDIAVELLRP